MIDYHIHLENGPYTLEWLRQFWEVGRRRGLAEIGITEHCHKFKEFYPMFASLAQTNNNYAYMQEWIAVDFQRSLDDYVNLIVRAQQSGLPVRLGLELDYLPNTEHIVDEIIDQYPFDYILGSVHIINGWGFDYHVDVWNGKDINKAYRQYYQTLLAAVKSSRFDIVAHFDVIKVFGHRCSVAVDDLIAEVLREVAKHNLCLEISSAGLRKPVNEIYPQERIIKQAVALQIPITFASDAHYPNDVGANWSELVTYARQAGYREYRIFAKRNASAEKLLI